MSAGDRARVAVVVGNPKPRSRTYESALILADRLGGADLVVDLAAHASELFDWGAPRVTELVEEVASSLVVVVASPTYKATYTGLLKAFLDMYGPGGLAGVVAVPVVVSGNPAHALVGEVHLRPLLVELGAVVPTRALTLVESQLTDLDPVIDRWWSEGGRALGAQVAAVARELAEARA